MEDTVSPRGESCKYPIDNYPKLPGECATCKHGEYITYYDGWHFDCHKHNSQVLWCDTCEDYDANKITDAMET